MVHKDRGRLSGAAFVVAILVVAWVLVHRGTPPSPGALGATTSGPSINGARAGEGADLSQESSLERPIVAPDHFGPVAPPAPPPAALRRFADVAPSGGTWAVMIGIDDYPGSSHDLHSAVADAEDVDRALGGMAVPSEHRLVLRNNQVTADIVRLSADWLVAHASPDAVAVFFYAGHVRKLGGSTEAILAADGATVTDADLAAHLRPLRARQAWIAMAACFGGGFTETLAPGRVLTGAAPAGQLAYENSAFGRSYMVEYMVRQAMIEGRAPASVQEAFEFAHAAIAREHPGREPVEFDQTSTPLVLRPPGTPAPPAPKPAPARSTSAAPAPAPAPGPTGSGGGSTGGGSSGGSGGSSGSGSSGGGSGGSGGSQPPPSGDDTCGTATLGVVHCH